MMFKHMPQEDRVVLPGVPMPCGIRDIVDGLACCCDGGWRSVMEIHRGHPHRTIVSCSQANQSAHQRAIAATVIERVERFLASGKPITKLACKIAVDCVIAQPLHETTHAREIRAVALRIQLGQFLLERTRIGEGDTATRASIDAVLPGTRFVVRSGHDVIEVMTTADRASVQLLSAQHHWLLRAHNQVPSAAAADRMIRATL